MEIVGVTRRERRGLPPQIATTFFIAQFIEMGKCLGRFERGVVGIVDDKVARCDVMGPQDDPPTGHQECVPGNLAVSKHPRQGRQRKVPRLARSKRAWLACCVTAVLVPTPCAGLVLSAPASHLFAGGPVLDVSTPQDSLGHTPGGQWAGHLAAHDITSATLFIDDTGQPALKIGQALAHSL